MTTTISIKAKVKDIKNINNSINCNPNFKLNLHILKFNIDENFDFNKVFDAMISHTQQKINYDKFNFKVTTMNDYSINYAMGSFLIGKTLNFKIKLNKKSCKVINFTAA
jgi:hypothetical protein|tara:strand:+ start:51 stop:377 length:327 start_codon:yes stop_codon:yes gene_type:complete